MAHRAQGSPSERRAAAQVCASSCAQEALLSGWSNSYPWNPNTLIPKTLRPAAQVFASPRAQEALPSGWVQCVTLKPKTITPEP